MFKQIRVTSKSKELYSSNMLKENVLILSPEMYDYHFTTDYTQ